MNRILAGLVAMFLAAPAVAVAQPNLSNMPANTVFGRLGVGTGPGQAIPFANLTTQLFAILCKTSDAFPVYNATTGAWVCSTAAGASAHLGATSDIYDFWIANPAFLTIPFLEMQFGKGGNLYTPPTGTSANIIGLQTLIDTGASGLGTTYNGISTDARFEAGTNGSIYGASFSATAEGTWTNPGATGGAVGLATVAKSLKGGDVFGENPYAWCQTTTCRSVVGSEIDTDNRINGTAAKKGLQIVDVATSTGTITTATSNVALHILAQTSALGYVHGIRIGDASSQFPITAAGSIFSTMAGTVTNGIDLSNLTVTGNAFVSPSFSISGAGALAGATGSFNQFASAGVASSTTGQFRLLGLTSGLVTIKPQDAAGTYNFNLPTTAGTAGANLTSGGGAAAAMTWMVPAQMRYCATAVNFNSATTDTALSISPLPTTRYVINNIRIGNASASISTATVGVFTATGGGGTALAANQAITVTATATDTNNNAMTLALNNGPTTAFNDATVQIRVGTAQGSGATADVCVYIVPL